MNFWKKYSKRIAYMAIPLVGAMCMTIEEVIHPQDAKVNSEITIQVKLKFNAETERTSKLAFGILAPKAWNIASNAVVSITTTAGLPQNVVTDNPLTVIPASELNPGVGQPWSASFQSRFGLLGNYGPMEWVVFESAHSFVSDASGSDDIKPINGVVTIKLQTGPDNMRVIMGYTYCARSYGFPPVGNSIDEYPGTDVIASKVLEVTGGDGPMNDYTSVSLISTTPTEFGFGDIFAINFAEETPSTTTALKGASKVFLWGRVLYNGGQEKVMSAINAKTQMEKVGDGAWQKYIYLRDFFDLPAGASIESTYFHFSDESGSIVVRNPEGEDFQIVAAADPEK